MAELRDVLLAVTKDTRWMTITELRERVAEAGGFASPEFQREAVTQWEMVVLRREIKRLRDDADFPVFANITKHDPTTGTEERVYMQERLFDSDEYRQVVAYYVSRTNYNAAMAKAYASRARTRYRIQIPLPFDLQ